MKKLFTVTFLLLAFSIPKITYADSACNIGTVYYENGQYAKAFKYMKKLVVYNNACAEYYLGMMYFYGQGTNKNIDLAVKYIEKASKAGYQSAIVFFDNQVG